MKRYPGAWGKLLLRVRRQFDEIGARTMMGRPRLRWLRCKGADMTESKLRNLGAYLHRERLPGLPLPR
jgi:hypothetical protein